MWEYGARMNGLMVYLVAVVAALAKIAIAVPVVVVISPAVVAIPVTIKGMERNPALARI